MLLKRPKPKEFHYSPRFYNPETDEEERKKRKLGFRDALKRRQKRGMLYLWVILLIIVLYFYIQLAF